jgi:dolichol-phosphate mannosyltransferase
VSNLDRPALGRMLRFGIVGASGVVVNQGLLMLLHGVVDLPLLVSSVLAIETSILSNFTLNSRWTWKIDLGGSLRGWLRKAVKYHAATVASAAVGNIVVLMSLVHLFGVDYRLGNLAGIGVGSGLNYLAGEFWVFRTPTRSAP